MTNPRRDVWRGQSVRQWRQMRRRNDERGRPLKRAPGRAGPAAPRRAARLQVASRRALVQ
jgi:hypothetical protein